MMALMIFNIASEKDIVPSKKYVHFMKARREKCLGRGDLPWFLEDRGSAQRREKQIGSQGMAVCVTKGGL